MLVRLYSVFDRVSCVFDHPLVCSNDAAAARAFNITQSTPDTLLYASPADFQLWYLGSMDNRSGDISTDGDFEPYKVCDGKPREVSEHE